MTREEFSVLALSYLEDIAAFSRRLTGNAADADDLVQATFERAFEAWPRLRDPAACRAWLFRIARNLFLDGRRASAVRSQLSLAVDTGASTQAFVVPAEAVERLSARELEAALDRLPREQREALKVDREERPDVDAIYMNAVQMLTGGGGWPMTVATTTDRKPFFGGTYFRPAVRAEGRAGGGISSQEPSQRGAPLPEFQGRARKARRIPR